jgi:hypothetical protein
VLRTSLRGDQKFARSLLSLSTSFVGRNIELAELARILGDPACRLLTLLGSGGIGKTRLALELAATHTTTSQVRLDHPAVGCDRVLSMECVQSALRTNLVRKALCCGVSWVRRGISSHQGVSMCVQMRIDAPCTCERQHTDNAAALVYRSSVRQSQGCNQRDRHRGAHA